MKAAESETTRQLLLKGRSPELEVKLAAAWEKHAKGDPESAPAIFAMAQLHVMDVHCSIIDREAELLAEFREVCQEQRLIFQSAVSRESKAILAGFEKRQAIFEQRQQRETEPRPLSATSKKANSLMPMVCATVLGILCGGYGMDLYTQRQLKTESEPRQAIKENASKGKAATYRSLEGLSGFLPSK